MKYAFFSFPQSSAFFLFLSSYFSPVWKLWFWTPKQLQVFTLGLQLSAVFFIIFLCFTRRFTYLPLNPWLSNAYLSVKLSDKHTIYSGAAQCQFCIVFYIITWCWSSCGCDSQLLEIKEDIGTQLVFGFLLMTKADILKMD